MGMQFELIEGEIGAVLYFTLSYEDENGVEQLFSLTGQTVVLRAWRDNPQGRTINDAACTPHANQTTNKGEGTFTFNTTTAAIDPGEHMFRFKCTDGGGNIRFFPKDPVANYGVINVSAAK